MLVLKGNQKASNHFGEFPSFETDPFVNCCNLLSVNIARPTFSLSKGVSSMGPGCLTLYDQRMKFSGAARQLERELDNEPLRSRASHRMSGFKRSSCLSGGQNKLFSWRPRPPFNMELEGGDPSNCICGPISLQWGRLDKWNWGSPLWCVCNAS